MLAFICQNYQQLQIRRSFSGKRDSFAHLLKKRLEIETFCLPELDLSEGPRGLPVLELSCAVLAKNLLRLRFKHLIEYLKRQISSILASTDLISPFDDDPLDVVFEPHVTILSI